MWILWMNFRYLQRCLCSARIQTTLSISISCQLDPFPRKVRLTTKIILNQRSQHDSSRISRSDQAIISLSDNSSWSPEEDHTRSRPHAWGQSSAKTHAVQDLRPRQLIGRQMWTMGAQWAEQRCNLLGPTVVDFVSYSGVTPSRL